MKIELTINGKVCQGDIPPNMTLAVFLREELRLTGTHIGCDTSSCGACTVLVNGSATKSCTVLAVQVDGAEVKTIEGMATNGQLHPIQEAFKENHGLQCGFCTPGMVMLAEDLLSNNPHPSENEIRHALEGKPIAFNGHN